MKLTVTIDPDQLNDIIKASLEEYHTYLYNAVWHKEEDYRLSLVDAFTMVLEQYQTPDEHQAYIAKFVN